MKFTDQLHIVKRLDSLIRRKATGSPEELANKVKLSRASIYRHIEILKELGAPVKYNKKQKCFFYEEDNFELKL